MHSLLRHPLSRVAAFFLALLLATSAAGAPDFSRLAGQLHASLVIDLSSGQVLHAHRAHERADPASLVKMMVVLLAMEREEKGELHLDDTYTVSAAASRIGGHQIYLKQGEIFTLRDLLKSVIIASANDAAFAVAEHVAGSHEGFVTLMNQRAAQLGMRDTYFANAHGLPPNRSKGEQANYTTAYDLAILAKALMKYPQVRQWASTRADSLRDGAFVLTNTNRRFLQRFEGADGFKTGYHPRGAGFSVVATATRDGRRLLAVILGAKTAKARLRASTQLLEWGFANELRMPSMTAAVSATAPEGAAAMPPKLN